MNQHKKLVCERCGASDTFSVSAIEYCTWVVDNHGEYLSSDGCHDSSLGDNPEFACLKCKDGFGKWRESNTPVIEAALDRVQKQLAEEAARQQDDNIRLKEQVRQAKSVLSDMGFVSDPVGNLSDIGVFHMDFMYTRPGSAQSTRYMFTFKCLLNSMPVNTHEVRGLDRIQFQVPCCINPTLGHDPWIDTSLTELRNVMIPWIEKAIRYDLTRATK